MVTVTATHADGFTLADRDDLPEVPHGGKYELVDGMLVVSAAPTPRHQDVVASMLMLLRAKAPGEVKVLHSPIDVVLSMVTTLQPDVVVARRDTITERGFDGPPLLAIKVLSPSNGRYDQLVKRRRSDRSR